MAGFVSGGVPDRNRDRSNTNVLLEEEYDLVLAHIEWQVSNPELCDSRVFRTNPCMSAASKRIAGDAQIILLETLLIVEVVVSASIRWHIDCVLSVGVVVGSTSTRHLASLARLYRECSRPTLLTATVVSRCLPEIGVGAVVRIVWYGEASVREDRHTVHPCCLDSACCSSCRQLHADREADVGRLEP
jgi:hypothetical protein